MHTGIVTTFVVLLVISLLTIPVIVAPFFGPYHWEINLDRGHLCSKGKTHVFYNNNRANITFDQPMVLMESLRSDTGNNMILDPGYYYLFNYTGCVKWNYTILPNPAQVHFMCAWFNYNNQLRFLAYDTYKIIKIGTSYGISSCVFTKTLQIIFFTFLSLGLVSSIVLITFAVVFCQRPTYTEQ